MDADLTGFLLQKIGSTCAVSTNAIAFNDAVINISNCNAKVELINNSHATIYKCEAAAVNAQIAGLVETLATAQIGAAAAIQKSLEGSGIPPTHQKLEDNVQNYLNAVCNAEAFSLKTIVMPDIMLTNCSDVNITAINQLDQVAQCGLGKATELLQASGLGTPIARPKNGISGTTVVYVVVFVFLALLMAAVLLGLFLRKRLAERQTHR